MKSVSIFVICLFIISCNGPASRVTHADFLENAPGDSLHAVRIPIGGDFLGRIPGADLRGAYRDAESVPLGQMLFDLLFFGRFAGEGGGVPLPGARPV